MSTNDAALLTPVGIVLALLMATPIFFHTRLHIPFSDTNDTSDTETDDWSHLVFCVEDWKFSNSDEDPHMRIYYSIFSMAMQ